MRSLHLDNCYTGAFSQIYRLRVYETFYINATI